MFQFQLFFHFIFVCLIFYFGIWATNTRDYFWLCTQELLFMVLSAPYVIWGNRIWASQVQGKCPTHWTIILDPSHIL